MADDRLAKRNALVLAVAQALAGGNNTVIAATAGIVGTMLARIRGLATLPVSVMVCGIWFGTLPLGYLARSYGRRFALQTGSVVGTLAGLISCVAVLQGSFLLFLRRHVLLRLLCGRAQLLSLRRRPTPRATPSGPRRFRTCWPAG